ncbi:Putative uncharacterized protein [Taphrina deformans PYCC 5710]|uniref:Uncharacterized protein n=1 Tax=Taphrina deformans (strain PYCC 5710 / ATCC 11124 / CBS 356.35 / IMI 108563 / JCM 9778 / NBRC 8474) TaxID=1097556 RepID=R4X9E1_TAPDE|nr:Putative uncharacterized protein [Taphrina deformans PYCC 5710]|eukprot:CCG82356.1 Putative uncharacterized protein [Taphrina deformans PYCC 5710]
MADKSDVVIETDFRNERLSLPPAPRLFLYTVSSSLLTFVLGAMSGGKKTSYQFLAENAHRLPRTHQGWYFYHKTKNYRVMLGGIQSGFKYAGRTMGWTLLYASTETALDRIRGTIDAANTVAAAVGTAGIFSWKNGFSRQLTKRTLRMSLLVGLGIGALQDGLIWAKGGRIWYLERLLDDSLTGVANTKRELPAG